MSLLCGNRLLDEVLRKPAIFFGLLDPLSQLERKLADKRYLVATSAVIVLRAWLVVRVEFVLCRLVGASILALPLLLAGFPDAVESSLGVSDCDGRGEIWVLLKWGLAFKSPRHRRQSGETNPITQQLAAIRTDHLKDLLRLVQEAGVVDRCGKLDVAEMTRTFRHVLRACLALELAINGTKARVVETIFAGLCLLCVHRLGVLDVRNAQALDLIRRHDTKLDLLDRLHRRTRVREA